MWELLDLTLSEMPHRPFLAVTADFSQLQPVSGGQCVYQTVRNSRIFQQLELHSDDNPHARCQDPILREFLGHVRDNQPSREQLANLFRGRHLGIDL